VKSRGKSRGKVQCRVKSRVKSIVQCRAISTRERDSYGTVEPFALLPVHPLSFGAPTRPLIVLYSSCSHPLFAHYSPLFILYSSSSVSIPHLFLLHSSSIHATRPLFVLHPPSIHPLCILYCIIYFILYSSSIHPVFHLVFILYSRIWVGMEDEWRMNGQ
jgi:hypothetical protein